MRASHVSLWSSTTRLPQIPLPPFSIPAQADVESLVAEISNTSEFTKNQPLEGGGEGGIHDPFSTLGGNSKLFWCIHQALMCIEPGKEHATSQMSNVGTGRMCEGMCWDTGKELEGAGLRYVGQM